MGIVIGTHPGGGTAAGRENGAGGSAFIEKSEEYRGNHGRLVLIGASADFNRSHDAGSTSSIRVPARSAG
jgi:hypothetical protein